MRYIKRGNEPSSLRDHREAIEAERDVKSKDYDDLLGEIVLTLRRQLSREQGHLCGYCMTKLRVTKPEYLFTAEDKQEPPRESRIDHWAPRESMPMLSLTWGNFVLACRGGERHGGAGAEPELPEYAAQYHCDKRKGKTSITLNPLRPVIESQVSYRANGRIARPGAGPEKHDTDLDDTLNLNATHLMLNRKRVLEEVVGWMKAKPRSLENLKDKVDEWSTTNSKGELREFCGVAVWQLRAWARARGGA